MYINRIHNEVHETFQLSPPFQGLCCLLYEFVGGVHRVLVGKPEGKRPLGRPRRRWEDNIKMDL